ncbi:PilZ domain-containing protein [uncultured Aquimonas sp.]|jgi:hypothetical protein|uniref:PilZ domain-containing protein n=1 Tax=uncultured Aquimonas sp. TaxID=385483 RepID=UPI000868F72E|nr:PilZ domain-containing protein [uncultured Aquimonas sp.]ODU42106.1 MAG: hypothetical protein ABS96_29235 [Xanthomonadaceae bacterium SCN 69-123]
MNESRRAKRKQAREAIEVFDSMTELSVGRIGNLSETGMMLMASAPLMEDALFQFRFTLGSAQLRQRTLEVGVHQLWSEPSHVPGQYWSGFRFVDIAPEDATHLHAWVEAPGSQYD